MDEDNNKHDSKKKSGDDHAIIPGDKRINLKDIFENQEKEGKIVGVRSLDKESIPKNETTTAKLQGSDKKKPDPLLIELLKINLDIRKRKKGKVELLKPIIGRKGEKVLYPNTIMAIQGPSGSGKSRLAQAMMASMLSISSSGQKSNMGFYCQSKDKIAVLIDTERNLNEQMPLAIQEIQTIANIEYKSDPENLEYTSLLNISRTQRLKAIKFYVEHLQKKHEGKHLVIFLDVLTDLVQDFNEPGECLAVIDYLNILINNHNCTIVCVIHENPGTTKMRGHLGTELSNKASTILQITQKDTGPANIRIRYMKCRNSKRYPDFYAEFDDETRTIREVDSTEVDKASNNIKALHTDVAKFLSGLKFPIKRRSILDEIMNEFDVSESTAESRLKEIWEGNTPIKHNGIDHILKKNKIGGELQYEIN